MSSPLKTKFYSLLHNFFGKHVEIHREGLFFTVFFLSASAIWLILAAVFAASAADDLRLLALAVRYVPEMARSAALAVPLSVAGGLIIDLSVRENS